MSPSARVTGVTGRKQRHTRHQPCPICRGYDELPRGKGVRCDGWTQDGVVHCAREQLAGQLRPDPNGRTWPHRLEGPCGCGEQHGQALPPRPRPLSHRRSRHRAPKASGPTHPPEVVYDYGDFQVCRWGEGSTKTFRQRQPDGRGGWHWHLDGITPHLYRREELLAAGPGALVFVCEGEKAVEVCCEQGLLSTCSPMGAGKWRDAYSPDLAGFHVIILADNDEPGRAHAAQVAASLAGVAQSVRIVDLPVPAKGDAFDFFTQGGTREELYRLALTTPVWMPADTAPVLPEDGEIAVSSTPCPSCQRLRQENAALRRELVQLREERSLIFAVQRNPGLRTEKATALAVACTLASKQQAGLADAEGFVPVALGQLADDAGESTDAAGRHLKRLEAAGYVEKRVRRTWDAERQQYVSELRLKPCAGFGTMLRQAATLTLTPNGTSGKGWGGERCPDHPQAAITRETIDRCAICHTELGRTSVHLNPQAAVSLAASHTSPPDQGEGLRAADLHGGTPLPESRTCPDCGGALQWVAAGCWACRSCGSLVGYAIAGDA